MKQPATPTLPSMNWAAPPSQSAAHARFGRGHSAGLGPVPHEPSSQCLQTSPPPVIFGPHIHTPLRGQIALYPSRTMGSAPPLTMSGGGNSQDGEPPCFLFVSPSRGREPHREGLSFKLLPLFFPTCGFTKLTLSATAECHFILLPCQWTTLTPSSPFAS